MSDYRLNVRIEINRMNEHGGHTGDRLAIDEDLRLNVSSFMEIAQVLGRFHELAEHIKAGEEPENLMSMATEAMAEAPRLVLSEESGGTGRVLWSRTIS